MERLTGYNSFGGPYGIGMRCGDNTDTIHAIIKRLASYEDTGLEPEEIERIKTAKAVVVDLALDGETLDVKVLRDLLQAKQQGRIVVLDEQVALAMCAGARAIEQNKRLSGVIYCWDVFGQPGGPKELSYFEAAQKLRWLAERALEGGEGRG